MVGDAATVGGRRSPGIDLGGRHAVVHLAGADRHPGDTATVTGKLTSRESHTIRDGAHHLTWPVLAQTGESVSYVLANVFNRRISTIWNGFDAAGNLVAVQEIVIEAFAALSVLPGQTLTALDEGGHWETYSDSLLFSLEDAGAQPEAVAAIESDALPRSWEFEAGPIGASGRIWIANPLDQLTTAVVAVVAGDRVFSTQRIVLGPHQGVIWSLQDVLASHPELYGVLSSAIVLVQAGEGTVAADVAGSGGRTTRGKSGEWVY